MRWHEKHMRSMAARAAGLVLLVALVSLGCAGSSDDPPSDSAVDPEPSTSPTSTATPVPEAAPTATSSPGLSDEARLDAARDALDAQGARDLIAWDVLDASVDGDLVTFQLCGWTGIDAFDAVYRSNWAVSAGPVGEPMAVEVGTSVDVGECLNTELIDSAFDFLAEYDTHWIAMLENPDQFGEGAIAQDLMTPQRFADAQVAIRRHLEAGTRVAYNGKRGHPLDVTVTDVAYRRLREGANNYLELAFCRDVDPRYGVYRDEVLVDDIKSEVAGEIGPHFADSYRIVRSENGDKWLYESITNLVWADCFALGDWILGVRGWLPGSTEFELVP